MEESLGNVIKKKKIQIYLLVCQFMFYVSHLVIFDMVKDQMLPISYTGATVIHIIISIGLVFICILFVKYFVLKKWALIVYITIVAINSVFQILTFKLDLATQRYSLLHYLLIASAFISLFIIGYIVLLTVKDIFLEKHDLTYSLVGAANIFFGIILIFAFFFSLLSISYSDLYGNINNVNELYNMSLVISSYTIAGIDIPYGEVKQLIKNIMTIESLLVQLFVVMIIGRLLSR